MEPEHHEKRLSSEEAVTHYKVPYSGQSLSFPGSEEGSHPQKPRHDPAGNPAVHWCHDGSRMPVTITCARAFKEEEKKTILSVSKDNAKEHNDTSSTTTNTEKQVRHSHLQQWYWTDKLTSPQD